MMHFFIISLVLFHGINVYGLESGGLEPINVLATLKKDVPNCNLGDFVKTDSDAKIFNEDLEKFCSGSETTKPNVVLLCHMLAYELKKACDLPTNSSRPSPAVYNKAWTLSQICDAKNVEMTSRWIFSRVSKNSKKKLGTNPTELCAKVGSDADTIRLARFFYKIAPLVRKADTAKPDLGDIPDDQNDKSLKETVMGAVKNAKDSVFDAAKGVTKKAGQLLGALTGNNKDDAAPADENAKSDPKQDVDTVKNATSKVGDEAKKGVKDAAEQTVDKTKTGLKQGTDAASNQAVDKNKQESKDKTDSTTDATKQVAKDKVDSTIDVSKQGTKEKADLTVDATKQGTKEKADQTIDVSKQGTKEKADPTVDATKQETKDKTDPTVNATKQDTKDKSDPTADTKKDAGDATQNTAEKGKQTGDEAKSVQSTTQPIATKPVDKEQDSKVNKNEKPGKETEKEQAEADDDNEKDADEDNVQAQPDDKKPSENNQNQPATQPPKESAQSKDKPTEQTPKATSTVVVPAKKEEEKKTDTDDELPKESKDGDNKPAGDDNEDDVEVKPEDADQPNKKGPAEDTDNEKNQDVETIDKNGQDNENAPDDPNEPENQPNDEDNIDKQAEPEPIEVIKPEKESIKDKPVQKIPDAKPDFEPPRARPKPKSNDRYGDEGWSGNFVTYFLLFTLFVVVGYLVLHNKNKLMAYALEGRRSGGSRTGSRPSHRGYEKLKNVNDVIPIDDTNPVSDKVVIIKS